jgi:putative NADPH-quinone reductase
MPAIMKNMFDSVFISGFAFKYWTEWKEDLLVWKKGSVIATCDAPSKIYLENSNWTWINLKTYFEKSLFWFCGIEMNDFKLFWNFRSSNENEKISFLKKL